ncbi:hypothetical protein [Sedimenticola sp.]
MKKCWEHPKALPFSLCMTEDAATWLGIHTDRKSAKAADDDELG